MGTKWTFLRLTPLLTTGFKDATPRSLVVMKKNATVGLPEIFVLSERFGDHAGTTAPEENDYV
jgi:hypothetical protein